MSLLEKLKNKWIIEGAIEALLASQEDLLSFQERNNVVLPRDLIAFFKALNGTGGDYTNDLYEFYSIDRLKKVKEEFKNWSGVPNYQDILNIDGVKDLYIFANFDCYLLSYAIRLYDKYSINKEIYVICGSEYKIIANSFTSFLELYLNESVELYFK